MKLKDSKIKNIKIYKPTRGNKKIIKKTPNQKNLIENKENIDNNINNQSDKDLLISTELNLDEIKLKVDYDKIESELNKLKNINKNDNNVKIPLNNNATLEEDLYYYSDEDEEKKEKNKISSITVPNIKAIIYSKNNKNQSFRNNMNNKKNNNINNYLKQLSLDPEKLEYGIDEKGNPVSIKDFKEEILIKNNNKNIKLIAYIIPNDSNKKDGNYLIDVDGQKIERNQNGDFIYLYNNKKIIIQNFDVQNPKLRIYGTRQRYSSLCSELSLHSQFSNKKFDFQIIEGNKNETSFNNNLKEGLKGNNQIILLNKKTRNKKDILSQRNKSNVNISNKNKKDKNRAFKFFSKSNSINDLVNQTRDILNKSRNNKIPNDINIDKNNFSLKNIYSNNSKFKISSLKEYENIKTQNNKNFLLLKNIFDNRLKKNSNIKIQNKNQLSSKNNKYIFANSNINISTSNNNDNLLQRNSNNSYKNSFSFFLNKKINKKKKDLILQKYKGSKISLNTIIKGFEANSTINESNFKSTFQKSIKNVKKLNKKFRHTDNDVSSKIFNSYNISLEEFPKKNDKQLKLNTNNEIKLKKKFKISKSLEKIGNKKYSEYSVLSKQADDMIKNYFRNRSYNNNEDHLKNNEEKNQFCFNKKEINISDNCSNRGLLNNKINNQNITNGYEQKLLTQNNQIKQLQLEQKENSLLKRLLQKSRNLNKNKYMNNTEDYGEKLIPLIFWK